MRSLELLTTPELAKKFLASTNRRTKITFVPTMGCLHEGHFSLIRQARMEGDLCLVSIFVNPLQFGQNEDFDRYPRPFEEDIKACQQLGVDAVFAPSTKDLLPKLNTISVSGKELSKRYCGKSRPDHFDGVLTIVSILFNILKPNIAYFGEKDFQQLYLIKKLVSELHLDTQVEAMPIVREANGLAMSSRNKYLTPQGRTDALGLHQALVEVLKLANATSVRSNDVVRCATKVLKEHGLQIDYVSLVDEKTLLPAGEHIPKSARLLLAAYVNQPTPVRLIDNAPIRLPSS